MLASFRDAPVAPPRSGSGIYSAEDKGAKAVHKVGSEAVVLDEKSHVNRAIERIEEQIQISIPP